MAKKPAVKSRATRLSRSESRVVPASEVTPNYAAKFDELESRVKALEALICQPFTIAPKFPEPEPTTPAKREHDRIYQP